MSDVHVGDRAADKYSYGSAQRGIEDNGLRQVPGTEGLGRGSRESSSKLLGDIGARKGEEEKYVHRCATGDFLADDDDEGSKKWPV